MHGPQLQVSHYHLWPVVATQNWHNSCATQVLWPCRAPVKCDKNYIEFAQDDANGFSATVVMTHYKTRPTHGALRVGLESPLFEPLILQHRLHSKFAPKCGTLFFTRSFTQPTHNQFVTLVGDALTIPRRPRVTATTFRHLTQTMWRDFIVSKGIDIVQTLRDRLDSLAAEGMQSSSNSVDGYYDDGEDDREVMFMLNYWDKFKEFVQRDFVAKSTRKPFNALMGLPQVEGLSFAALG